MDARKKDVIIIDEGHNLSYKVFDNIRKCITETLIIILFDPDQRTFEDGMSRDPEWQDCLNHLYCRSSCCQDSCAADFTLSTQFRCNGEDGYLRFVDEILLNKPNSIYKANYLDFDVKLIKDQMQLDNLLKYNKIPLVTGPKYNNPKTQLLINGSKIDNWKYNNGEVYLDDIDSGRMFFTQVESIRGLETDKMVVYISDDPNDIQFDSVKKIVIGKSSVINTYRVLLTRAMKSCHIFCENKKLRDFLHDEKRIEYLIL